MEGEGLRRGPSETNQGGRGEKHKWKKAQRPEEGTDPNTMMLRDFRWLKPVAVWIRQEMAKLLRRGKTMTMGNAVHT